MARILFVLSAFGRTFDVEIRNHQDPTARPSATSLEAAGSATVERNEPLNAVQGFSDPFGFTRGGDCA